MIDSHCHLDHEPLRSDLSNILKRSKEVGIEKLLTISTSFESFSRVKEIVNIDKIIYGTIGIHPHETNNDKINCDLILEKLKDSRPGEQSLPRARDRAGHDRHGARCCAAR